MALTEHAPQHYAAALNASQDAAVELAQARKHLIIAIQNLAAEGTNHSEATTQVLTDLDRLAAFTSRLTIDAMSASAGELSRPKGAHAR